MRALLAVLVTGLAGTAGYHASVRPVPPSVRNAIVEGPRSRSEVLNAKDGSVEKVVWGNTGYTPLQYLVAFSQGEYYSYPSVSYAQGWSLIYFLREVVPQNKKYAAKWGHILDTYFFRKQKGDPKVQPPPPMMPKKAVRDPNEETIPTRIPTRAMLKQQGERRKAEP